jgi:hypothetical protein
MKCPGQDTGYWKPGDIFDTDCPHCGNKVEFFKDEATRRCRSCRKTVVNPRMDLGCAAYCRYAANCLGELGPELLAKRNDLLKDRVALEVKRILGRDFQRIAHAIKVAGYVEEIAGEEKAEPVLALAAYLHVFLEGREPEGGELIRSILERLAAGPELADRMVYVIERLHAGTVDSIETKVLSDAHRLALAEEKKDDDAGQERRYLTETGGILARRLQHAQTSTAGGNR